MEYELERTYIVRSMFGKMVIPETRIPVELILEKIALDYSFDQLKEAYPRITTSDIQACLLFAADNNLQ
jgi:uncharacterized protein (DUF433 family)